MDIKELLLPAHTLINVRATDKTSLIRDLSARAAAAFDLPAERISDELLKREALGSTGTGGGIAIPAHATTQKAIRDSRPSPKSRRFQRD